MKKQAIYSVIVAALLSSKVSAEVAVGAQVAGTEHGPMVGMYFSSTKKDNYGWYFDLSSNLESGEGEDYDFGYNKFGDPETGTVTEEFAVHIGGTKSISTDIFGYVGVGIYKTDEYLNLYDPSHILSDDGHYNISTGSDSTLSMAAGLLYNASEKVQFKVGGETGSSSVNVGIGYRF